MTTEREMLDLLHRRFTKVSQGLGDRYLAGAHVKNRLGFEATRQLDFVAQDTWPAAGAELHGCEVKCSRGDWLRELRAPDKAMAFMPFMHRWWVAVPDKAMVKLDELPEGWGLLAPSSKGLLRPVRVAPRLAPAPMPREMTICLMRAIYSTAPQRRAVLS